MTSVVENSPLRQPDRQTIMMTENISSRTHYDCENSTDDWDSENGQVADGLIKGYPKLTSRPIHEPNERLAKRCRHLPVVETAAGCTSALAGDATREHLGPPQRLPDGSFPPTSSEAQEVFGRGILRIQPHGHRNVYVITISAGCCSTGIYVIDVRNLVRKVVPLHRQFTGESVKCPSGWQCVRCTNGPSYRPLDPRR